MLLDSYQNSLIFQTFWEFSQDLGVNWNSFMKIFDMETMSLNIFLVKRVNVCLDLWIVCHCIVSIVLLLRYKCKTDVLHCDIIKKAHEQWRTFYALNYNTKKTWMLKGEGWYWRYCRVIKAVWRYVEDSMFSSPCWPFISWWKAAEDIVPCKNPSLVNAGNDTQRNTKCIMF